MAKGKKFFAKKKKGFKSYNKKSKKSLKEPEIVNKKALFNRYKNKQKVEEELSKKKLFEKRFQQSHYSESEEEEDTLTQLVSTFIKPTKNRYVEDSDQSSEELETDDDQEMGNSDHDSDSSSKQKHADMSIKEDLHENYASEQTLMVGKW